METKKCTKCGEVKVICEFVADRSKKDGRSSACKACRKHIKATKEYFRKWRESNIEKCKIYNKTYLNVLNDTLVKRILLRTDVPVTDETIEIKRTIIKIKRLKKQLNEKVTTITAK